MTSKEAVRIIKHHMEVHKLYEERAIKITEALEMAIRALENEPYQNPDELINSMTEVKGEK